MDEALWVIFFELYVCLSEYLRAKGECEGFSVDKGCLKILTLLGGDVRSEIFYNIYEYNSKGAGWLLNHI